jgi:hypothetical protein
MRLWNQSVHFGNKWGEKGNEREQMGIKKAQNDPGCRWKAFDNLFA